MPKDLLETAVDMNLMDEEVKKERLNRFDAEYKEKRLNLAQVRKA
jgi:hypothetical protein